MAIINNNSGGDPMIPLVFNSRKNYWNGDGTIDYIEFSHDGNVVFSHEYSYVTVGLSSLVEEIVLVMP